MALPTKHVHPTKMAPTYGVNKQHILHEVSVLLHDQPRSRSRLFSGVFTAPYRGLYVFSATFGTKFPRTNTSIAFKVGDNRALGFSEGRSSAAVELDRGDEVKVSFRSRYGGAIKDVGAATRFSGALVQRLDEPGGATGPQRGRRASPTVPEVTETATPEVTSTRTFTRISERTGEPQWTTHDPRVNHVTTMAEPEVRTTTPEMNTTTAEVTLTITTKVNSTASKLNTRAPEVRITTPEVTSTTTEASSRTTTTHWFDDYHSEYDDEYNDEYNDEYYNEYADANHIDYDDYANYDDL